MDEQPERTPDELLPVIDEDRRWLPLASAYGVRFGRVGNAYHAARDLQWALAQRHLRCLCLSVSDGGRSLVLPLAWGSLIALAVSDDRVFVFDRRTGDEVRGLVFLVWGLDLDGITWPVAPPDEAAEPALPVPHNPYRIVDVSGITPQVLIGHLVDHILYPNEGLPPGIKTATLEKQCTFHWKEVCDANSVRFPDPPNRKVFKAFIEKRLKRQGVP